MIMINDLNEKSQMESLYVNENIRDSLKDILDMSQTNQIAKILVDTGSFKIDMTLSPKDWYTWSSGIKAPCYCNCRYLNCFPSRRRYVAAALAQSIKKCYPQIELVVGVVAAGIPWASYIAEQLNLPLAYVRSSKKTHGVGGLVECSPRSHQKAVIIDDLIASGESIAKAIHSLQNEVRIETIGVQSIVNWGFETMRNNLKGFHVRTLTSFPSILKYAFDSRRINENEYVELNNFYQNPAKHVWTKTYAAT
jgi:orotate phosphoribosyltransferase